MMKCDHLTENIKLLPVAFTIDKYLNLAFFDYFRISWTLFPYNSHVLVKAEATWV